MASIAAMGASVRSADVTGKVGVASPASDNMWEIPVIKDEEYYDKRKHEIFEEWATLTPYLPTVRDGDGEYESDATKAYFMCFEFAFKRGVLFGVISDSATKINGELCDRVAELEKQLAAKPEPVLVSLGKCSDAAQDAMAKTDSWQNDDMREIAKAILDAAG